MRVVVVRDRPPKESLAALSAVNPFTDADHRQTDDALVPILNDRLTLELVTPRARIEGSNPSPSASTAPRGD